MTNNLTVIIRSSGERTLSYCKKLLEFQVPEENIIVIEEAPFSAALRKTLQVGIDKEKEWTLCIDADVLVKADVLPCLMESAENADDNIFEIQGLVLDKFFPILRPAGNHLYRTAFMDKAIKLIPEEGTSLRPESDMLNEMSANGYPWQQIDLIVGLHDFKQYYGDIYKKCFLQAHKHTEFVSLAEPYWDSKKDVDNDFRVALLGVRSGKIYAKNVFVDRNFLTSETNDVLKLMKIEEKKPIPAENFLVSFVDNIFEAQNYNDYLNKEIQKRMFPLQNLNKVIVIKKNKTILFKLISSIRNGLGQTGPLRIIPWVVGKFLQKLGRGLCQNSELNNKKMND
jgi:hypothetical protein